MGKVTGFLEIDRQVHKYQPASDRIRHFREFTLPMSDKEVEKQAARCMDCGIPFCHGPTGCPIHNQIPDWNDLVYNGDWDNAIRNLHSTNNFPEFTGRICPAPCEEACTLNLEDIPVAIKTVEQAIADKAYETRPYPAAIRRRRRPASASPSSAPARPAWRRPSSSAAPATTCMSMSARAEPGGLMRYGIPDFKMEKHYIDRRVEQMQGEGVTFHCGVNVGVDKPVAELLAEHDAVLYCGGSETPRAAGIPGDDLAGVHDAMPYLVQQNQRVGGENIQSVGWPSQPIIAGGKHVVVVGGGDTASDCVGTAFRQGAVRVTQLDIRPQPPEKEDKLAVWPYWATKMRTSSSQAEGAEREFQVATLEFIGEEGQLTGVKCCEVDEKRKPIAGTEFVIRADLAFIAIGFAGPFTDGVLKELDGKLKLDTDSRRSTNVDANDRDYRTSVDKLYAAGDVRRGQSLVVWAIREGRQAARAIDEALMGSTVLPA